MKFADIPQFVDHGSCYHVDVEWLTLGRWIDGNKVDASLDVCPDFQRGHVWTEAQQIAFVEFCLRGGGSSRTLLFNCPGWQHASAIGQMVLVDGLQRLTAVQCFLAGEIPAFGHFLKDYEDPRRLRNQRFSIYVNDLPTRAAVLEWYLQLNAGGTPHAAEEISRVQALLDAEPKPTATT